MSEPTPFPAAGVAPQPPVDPLAGDWSEGLRGPVRALGLAEPRLLVLDGTVPPPALRPAISEPPKPAPPADEVEAPDAWGSNEDPLHSHPPAASTQPSVIANITGAFQAPSFQADITPPSPAPAFLPDITPPSPAPVFLPDITPPSPAPAFSEPPAAVPPSAAEFKAEITPAMAVPAPLIPPAAEPVMVLGAEDSAEHEAPVLHTPGADAEVWGSSASTPAPTPWSEQVPAAAAEAAWDAPPPVVPQVTMAPAEAAHGDQVVATEDVIWSAPPPAEHAAQVTDWKAEAPPTDWEEVRKPDVPVAQAAADWSTLSTGPDWSAPPAAEAPADESWGAPPPAPVADEWEAAPAEEPASEWSAPPAVPESEWTAPAAGADDWMAPPAATPPAAAAPTKSWGGPPVGASALEQLDAEPQEAVPGAAKDLFGSVAMGESLAGDDEPHEPEPHELGPPEELASPEEVLKPVEMSDEDADLLVPVDDEPAHAPAPPRATTLAVMPMNPLEVRGEHRVAVHMRRGGTKRGSVKDVDLGKPQFPLLPQGGGASEAVYHADVKAVFFMLAPGEKVQRGDGARVKVTFSDGRSIEGVRLGSDAKPGFFMVPSDAQRTNTRRIYVARDATSEIRDL